MSYKIISKECSANLDSVIVPRFICLNQRLCALSGEAEFEVHPKVVRSSRITA
jgi:hypothetical protein